MRGLGGLPERRLDQTPTPPPAAQSPGSAAGILRARQVIIFGTTGNLLVYSGAPHAGNLIASISGADGTDAYGNAYFADIMVQSGAVRAILKGGQLTLTGGLGQTPGSLVATPGALTLTGPTGAGLVAAFLKLIQNTGADNTHAPAALIPGPLYTSLQASPAVAEDWHSMQTLGYQHGWSDSGSGPIGQYRLIGSPPYECEFAGDIKGGTTTDGTPFVTLPADYRPNSGQIASYLIIPGTSTIGNGRVFADTSGELQVFGISSLTTPRIYVNGRIKLTL